MFLYKKLVVFTCVLGFIYAPLQFSHGRLHIRSPSGDENAETEHRFRRPRSFLGLRGDDEEKSKSKSSWMPSKKLIAGAVGLGSLGALGYKLYRDNKAQESELGKQAATGYYPYPGGAVPPSKYPLPNPPGYPPGRYPALPGQAREGIGLGVILLCVGGAVLFIAIVSYIIYKSKSKKSRRPMEY